MKHFRVFSYPEEAEWAPAWAARAAGDRRMKRTASTEVLGCKIEAGQDPKTEILDDMNTTTGLWIDHRKAVIAIVSAEGEETMEIRSNVEKQPGRFVGVRSTTPYEAQQVKADDSREREFTGQLNKYYAEVIAAIRDAESILIFGPGEAKGELKKRLEHARFGGHIIAFETADKMTDRQIAAKVREYFHKGEKPEEKKQM